MLNYLKDSFYWLHLMFFKPITLQEKSSKLTRKESFKILLRIYLTAIIIVFLLEGITGISYEFLGFTFDWLTVLKLTGIVFGVGLVFSLVGGLVGGLLGGLLSGMFSILLGGLLSGLVGGLLGGLVFSLISSLYFSVGFGLVSGLFSGLVNGLVGGLVSLIGGLIFRLFGDLDKGFNEGINSFIIFVAIYLFVFFRPFYLFPYLWQYFLAKKKKDLSLKLFQNSPVYWDAVIALPLPYLSNWLVQLVIQDRKRGFDEINFVSEKRPYQRKAAQKALLTIAGQDLQKFENIEELKAAKEVSGFLPSSFPKYGGITKEDLSDIKRRINDISDLAQDFENRETIWGKIETLENLERTINDFRSSLAFSTQGKAFQPAIEKWSKRKKRNVKPSLMPRLFRILMLQASL